jgi:hypothetical protein
MAEYILPSGDVVLLDDADVGLMAGRNWYAAKRGPVTYVSGRYPGRKRGEGSRGFVFLHHLISGLPRVDHKNGNGLDNRRENLRPATQAQNGLNRAPKKGKRFKGVFFDKRRGTWYAQIGMNWQVTTSPTGLTEEECALWYDQMARKLHGDFARLNFPDEE